MGTFLWYFGESDIPEEKRAEFTGRALKILDAGGMMQAETVKLFGKEFPLLHPLEPNEHGNYLFHYNYFEGRSWETAGLYLNNEDFGIGSNKVGWAEFNMVCCAVYLLTEFYDRNRGRFCQGGEIVPAEDIIGWLNYLLDEHYTNKRVLDTWRIAQLLHEAIEENDWDKPRDGFAPTWLGEIGDDFIVEHYILLFLYDFVMHFDPEWFVQVESFKKKSEDEFCEEDFGALLGMWAMPIKKAVDAIAEDLSDTSEQKIERLKAIMRDRYAMGKAMKEDGTPYSDFAYTTAASAVPISARIVAQRFNLDYWALLDEVMDGDVAVLQHNKYVESVELPPVEPISTEEYLEVTGDDRAFWWRENGDVAFSEEMTAWLDGLCRELDEIAAADRPYVDGVDFMRALGDMLSELSKHRLYAFREMYYTFLLNWNSDRVQPAVVLLGRLTERYDLKNDAEREWLRRYLAVLGNPELRRKALRVAC